MRKRILSFILIMCMAAGLITSLPLTAAAAASGTCGDNLTWTLDDDGTLTISGSGNMTDWSFYPDVPWHSSSSAVKTVIISDGVTSIGDWAFTGCSSLTSVTIPDSVTSIGFEAFSGCSSLTSVTIPDSVTSIGCAAFSDCSSLTSVTIPNSVTSISDSMFSGCSSLPSVTIPDSVTSIGSNMFSYCYSLTSVTIPNSVTSIDSLAFRNCSSLTSVIIPDSVMYIFNNAFWDCYSLTSVTIPDSVIYIGSEAFNGCRSLTSVTIPDSVTSIGDEVFVTCSSLTSVTIPNSVTSISDSMFSGCSSLPSVTIPDSVKSIGISAFWFCYNLTSVTIPDSVKSIGTSAFGYCSSLTDVYYAGSKEQWKAISVGSNNSYLTNATIHYNSSKPGNSGGSAAYFAEISYNGNTYDLLSQPINIDKDSVAEVSVKVNCTDWNGNERIYLAQDVKNAVELQNNISKTIVPSVEFLPDKEVYILIVDEETGKSQSWRTRLKIIEGTASGEFLPTGDIEGINFKLGQENGFTVPNIVPIFGGTDIEWKFDFIPVSVEYDHEDSNKINIVFGTNIMHVDSEEGKFFEDFDFKEYKKAVKKAVSKSNRTLKQLRNDFKMSKQYKMKLFGGNVVGGGKGKKDFDFDVAGYAEANIIDGQLRFIEGQLCLNVEMSCSYQGQLFIWVVPVYYEIGTGIGAGFEGDMININPESFTPQFEAYLTAKVMANIGGGVGVAKVATVGAEGKGSLNLKTALHKEYLKAWGEGEANFNVKVFGKKVAEKTFAKGDFLIYETGNGSGLIKDGAVALASLEEENLYASINPNEVYENESRTYLASPTEWYADMPPIMLLSADYTNKDLQLMAENVYTEAAPIMRNVGGQKVMVMLWDNPERDDVNRTMLVYSVYDDEAMTWSAPVAVADDGTADFYPCFNDGYLVWQNEKSKLDDNMTLSDIAKRGEICIAKWNGNGFDAPVQITDNDALDTQPYVCAENGEISVVWTTNTENDIIGLSGRNAIMKTIFTDGAWAAPETVIDDLNAVANLSAGYTEGGLCIAYVADDDSDLQTIDDRDICIVENGLQTKLTDNDILDSNPVFDGNIVYYYSGGNIAYSSIDGSVSGMVFDEQKAGLTDTFTVAANANGDTAIWWTKAVDEGTEIFCALKQNGEWSDEIQITELGNQSKYPVGLLEEDGSMLIAFNNSAWLDGDVTQCDLYTLRVAPSYDLAVADAYIDEDSMTVYATIKNNGELAIDAYTVSLIDNGVNAEQLITEPIKAGGTAEIEIQYVKPEDLDKRTITLNFSTDCGEEFDTANNSFDLTVGRCDVEVSGINSFEKLPEAYVVATIANTGYSDTGAVTVDLRKNTADGEVVSTQTIDNLAAGESRELTFSYDAVTCDNIQWYVTAAAENEEISLGNNNLYIINNYYNTVENYSHEILRYSVSDNVLTVNAYAENNTDEELNAVSIAAIYDIDGVLKGLELKDCIIAGYDSSAIDFRLDNYTYADGDYIRLLLWQDMSSAIPVLKSQDKAMNIQ